MTARIFARTASGLALFCAALAAGGCSSEKPTGTVAGIVKYKGNPLTAGEVNFLSKTGSAGSAKIDANGQYKVTGELEAGEYKAYFAPPRAEPHAPGTKAAAVPKVDVPAKFRDPGSSGVVVTVKPGSNDIAVEFKD
ncbi:Uncharacterized protein OS=Planctomyces maris DSM 8797 GN=PM8797T_22398 PE=4 SV=1 [Gemmata massiliana]|uniref:Carboxypeptidase regulatory-like domain-containing protein n=1 Tax=Gemmata massiliana TaxID=1210884 RepID=A0A6P2CVL2_9BACT|nr:hypothetical protein [Gemmata massiliana]VTR91132.1 Uncharacterized protein OS=Planctomyces maris DSM 8797 GN=PM8797T_22398 PE=4 SV=1 [Gemmata massiliana]